MQVTPRSRQVEAREMEDLRQALVAQDPLQVGRVVLRRREVHQMGIAVPGRQLHHAQPVAVEVEPERLGIHRQVAREAEAGGQVVTVECHAHGVRFRSSGAKAASLIEARSFGARE